MKIHPVVAASIVFLTFGLPAGASAQAAPPAQDRVDELLGELGRAAPDEARRIIRSLEQEFGKSGSATMDLLLQRGRDALERGETGTGIGHLTALTDHAPRFAEGWHLLALGYFQADLYGPALDALERALILEPRHIGAMRGMATMLEQLGERALAFRMLERILDLHPHDADVLEALDRLRPEVEGTAL